LCRTFASDVDAPAPSGRVSLGLVAGLVEVTATLALTISRTEVAELPNLLRPLTDAAANIDRCQQSAMWGAGDESACDRSVVGLPSAGAVRHGGGGRLAAARLGIELLRAWQQADMDAVGGLASVLVPGTTSDAFDYGAMIQTVSGLLIVGNTLLSLLSAALDDADSERVLQELSLRLGDLLDTEP
jgi:hypothetical protein